MRSTKTKKNFCISSLWKCLHHNYGHIIKPKLNRRFFDDFRPGHVPLIQHVLFLQMLAFNAYLFYYNIYL